MSLLVYGFTFAFEIQHFRHHHFFFSSFDITVTLQNGKFFSFDRIHINFHISAFLMRHKIKNVGCLLSVFGVINPFHGGYLQENCRCD